MLTIGIPSYNYAPYIRKCVESALSPLSEVIVVDDCSTDNSVELIREYPVKLIEHSRNLGRPAASMNEILEAATGDYVLMLDADDFLLPGAVEAFHEHFGPDWLIADLASCDSNDVIVSTWSYEGWPLNAKDAYALVWRQPTTPVSMKGAFSLQWIRENDLKWCEWETQHMADDCRTCLEWLKTDPVIERIPGPLHVHRRHVTNWSGRESDRLRFYRELAEYLVCSW